MAGFSVVEHPVRTIWMPIDYASTVYIGQLVVAGVTAACSGVKAWHPAGAADTTADQVPFGVVVGLNKRTPTYASTYSADYDTQVTAQASQVARDYVGAEGMWGPTDPAAMAQVAVIGPDTILKGSLFNGAWGTVLGTLTSTTDSSTGAGFTTNAADSTLVAYNGTFYCRKGLNAGLYRISNTSHATVHTFALYWPYDIAIGDTFVAANVVPGTCTMMTDSAGTYIDNAAEVTTSDYIWADVLSLDLKPVGQESVLFRINSVQFAGVRAA